MKIGYARVSTHEQSLDMQIDALKNAECDTIYTEKVSSVKQDRPIWQKCLSSLNPGDELVFYKLDRIGRSTIHLLETMNQLKAMDVKTTCLTFNIDQTTAMGKLLFTLFSSLAEFERNLIIERTKDGLKAAKRRGKLLGRPKGLSLQAEQKSQLAAMYYQQGENSANIISKLEISKPTLYRYLRYQNVKIG